MRAHEAVPVLQRALDAGILADEVEQAVRALMPAEATAYGAEPPYSVAVTVYLSRNRQIDLIAVASDPDSAIEFDQSIEMGDVPILSSTSLEQRPTGRQDITLKMHKVRLVHGADE